MPKPILCLDFDGVCTTYASGWQGVDVCNDPPVRGLGVFLDEALQHFTVHIFSARSAETNGRIAMLQWFEKYYPADLVKHLRFPEFKPPALLTLDDRAMLFTGRWPDMQTLLTFKPWHQKTPLKGPSHA